MIPIQSFRDEFVRIKEAGGLADAFIKYKPHTEIAGLGALLAPSIDELQAHIRAGSKKDYTAEGVKKRLVMPHVAKPVLEAGGLGLLLGPSIAEVMRGGHMSPPSHYKDPF